MLWLRMKKIALYTIVGLLVSALMLPPCPANATVHHKADPPEWGTDQEVAQLCREFEQVPGFKVRTAEIRLEPVDNPSSMLHCILTTPNGDEHTKATIWIELFASAEDARKGWRRDQDRVTAYDSSYIGHDYSIYRLHKNSDMTIHLYRYPTANANIPQQLERIAMAIVDRKPGKDDEPDDHYTVSIDYSTTPFVATVTVLDSKGKPAPNMPVTISLDFVASYNFYQTYSYGADPTWNNMTFNPRGLELVDMMPPTLPNDTDPMEVEDKRVWRTDAYGQVNISLLEFSAVSPKTRQLQRYRLNVDRFRPTTIGYGLDLVFYAKAMKDDGLVVRSFDDEEKVTASAQIHMNHIARITKLQHLTNGETTLEVYRTDRKITIESSDLKKGGKYEGGFGLLLGDTIKQKSLQQVNVSWVTANNLTITVLKNRGPKDYTIEYKGTSADNIVFYITTASYGIALAGIVFAIWAPPPKLKFAGVVVAVMGLVFAAGAEELYGVKIVQRSLIYVEAGEEMSIYTVEGSADTYDWFTDEMVTVNAGEMVTHYADGSFSRVRSFDALDIDPLLLGDLDPVQSVSTPESAETAAGTHPTREHAATPDQERVDVAESALLFEDNFDQENGGEGLLNYGGFVQWEVESGTVDLIGNGYFDFYPETGLFLDLDGSRNAGGVLVSAEEFSLTPGSYRLEFDLAGHPYAGPNSVTVFLGDVYAEEFTLPHDPELTGFTHINRTVNVDEGVLARLEFVQAGADNVGVLLDNVRLVRLGDGATSIVEPKVIPDEELDLPADIVPPSTPAEDPPIDDGILADLMADLDLLRGDGPVFVDNFWTAKEGWRYATGEGASVTFEERTLHVNVTEPDYHAGALNEFETANLLVEVDAQQLSGERDAGYGLVFLMSDGDNFHYYHIDGNGNYWLRRRADGEEDTLIDWTYSPAIDSNPEAVNRLGVLVLAPYIMLLVNGEIIDVIEDDGLTWGSAGPTVVSGEEGGVTVAFDNFKLWDWDVVP